MCDPVNSKVLFFVTKRLQLRFKKNTAAAAEPNRLKEEGEKRKKGLLRFSTFFSPYFLTFKPLPLNKECFYFIFIF
jgi:hypothetical protein